MHLRCLNLVLAVPFGTFAHVLIWPLRNAKTTGAGIHLTTILETPPAADLPEAIDKTPSTGLSELDVSYKSPSELSGHTESLLLRSISAPNPNPSASDPSLQLGSHHDRSTFPHRSLLKIPDGICTNMSSQPMHANYTQPYACAMKHDYAILGLYYDTCTLVNLNHSNTPSPTLSTLPVPLPLPNNFFCCDPVYSQPAAFDSLCTWGNGTNIAEWQASGHPPGSLPTSSVQQIREARCFVSPIVSPPSLPLLLQHCRPLPLFRTIIVVSSAEQNGN